MEGNISDKISLAGILSGSSSTSDRKIPMKKATMKSIVMIEAMKNLAKLSKASVEKIPPVPPPTVPQSASRASVEFVDEGSPFSESTTEYSGNSGMQNVKTAKRGVKTVNMNLSRTIQRISKTNEMLKPPRAKTATHKKLLVGTTHKSIEKKLPVGDYSTVSKPETHKTRPNFAARKKTLRQENSSTIRAKNLYDDPIINKFIKSLDPETKPPVDGQDRQNAMREAPTMMERVMELYQDKKRTALVRNTEIKLPYIDYAMEAPCGKLVQWNTQLTPQYPRLRLVSGNMPVGFMANPPAVSRIGCRESLPCDWNRADLPINMTRGIDRYRSVCKDRYNF